MTQPDVLFTVFIPLAVLGVLAFALLGSRLSAEMRRRFEFALALVFYPVSAIFWGWKAWSYGVDDKGMLAILMVVMAGLSVIQGVNTVRQGRFAPAVGRGPA